MAFQMDFDYKGFEVLNGYIRIDFVSGNKERLQLSLGFYKDKDITDGILIQKNYTFVPSVSEESLNYHKQGYENLKTSPEFENAIDV